MFDEIEVYWYELDVPSAPAVLGGGGATSMREEWMPPAAIICCAAGGIMNCANSLAAFGLLASLMNGGGEQIEDALGRIDHRWFGSSLPS